MEHVSEPGEISVRRANADDIPFIRSLTERFARVGTPPWRDTTQMEQFHQQSAEEVVAALNTSTSLVLLAEDRSGTRLGFIYVIHNTDFFTSEPQGYIADIAVSEQAEGKGVGRMLMEHAEIWARAQGYRILALDVFAFNTHARSFYQHLGYVEETVKLVKELHKGEHI